MINEEQIKQRIQELEALKQPVVNEANRQLAIIDGAIFELKRILGLEDGAEGEESADE